MASRSKYRSNPKSGGKSANEHEEDFSVFGYSAKLHESNEQNIDENKLLIPWNGDEEQKVDRGLHNGISYDVRLYLNSLDEFDEIKAEKEKTIAQADEEEDSAEKLEEELCEEERYVDMYLDMTKRQLENDEEKRGNKAEIGFTYDESIPALNEKIEEIEDESYEKPATLKLPVGIITPNTMRQSTLIEQTAQFVVLQGPQMEIVIKAKQRQNAEQFGFLDFDHLLHPYYKYICKLIREKKYTPQPPKRKKAKSPTPSESDSDSNEEGYLHPLLQGSNTKSIQKLEPGFIGPNQRPSQKKKPEETGPDLNALVQQYHSGIENPLYSSLLKGLHSILPGKKTDEIESKVDEPISLKQEVETLFETDEHRINDYNKWYVEFYGRPSPYLPGPPPLPRAPMADSAVESGITVAAKYVAFNGAAAEQRLIEHNGNIVHFLLPRSPYYTFYQSKIRQIQWQLLQKCHQQQIENVPVSSSSYAQLELVPPPMPPVSTKQFTSSTDLNLVPIELPLHSPISIEQKSENGHNVEMDTIGTDKKQQERREKARLFMERILNERMAEKNKKIKTNEDVESPSDDQQLELREGSSKQTSGVATTTTAQSMLSPYQLSKAISTMIDQQIKKTLGTPALVQGKTPKKQYSNSSSEEEERRLKTKKNTEYDKEDSEEEEKRHKKKRKRHRERSTERRRHRRRSRSRSSLSRSRSPRKSTKRY